MWIQMIGGQIPVEGANNGDFVIKGALDNLSGQSTTLISLRSRGRFSRPFVRVADIRRAVGEGVRTESEELVAKVRGRRSPDQTRSRARREPRAA
jgi:ABC-type uncharacterized transport system involved in gliding motility auxiliary subunit